MTILFSTSIGGIEIKLIRNTVSYTVTLKKAETDFIARTVNTYAEASTALGNAIAHAIEQLHGSENLP